MRDPLWRKAPALLLRFPALAAGIVIASVVLGLTGAAGSLFLASVQSAALATEMGRLTPETAGVTVSTYAVTDPARFATANAAVREETGRIPGLGEPIVDMRATTTARLSSGASGEVRVQILARSGALAAVEPIEHVFQDGLWLPESVAGQLGLAPGTQVTVLFGGQTARVPVQGVYRDLLAAPLDSYWQPLAGIILPRETPTGPQTPPPLVLASETVFLSLGKALGDNSRVHWQFPLTADRLTPQAADDLAAAYTALERQALDPGDSLAVALDELSRFSFELDVSSVLPSARHRAEDAAAAAAGPAASITLVGQAVAVAVLGAAAGFRIRARRAESRLLVAQGVGAVSQGARAVLETAPAVALGAAAGWMLAVSGVPRLGPSAVLDPGVTATALRSVAAMVVIGATTVGAVTALGVLRDAEPQAWRGGRIAARMRWDLLALGIAGVAYWQLTARGAAAQVDAPSVDALLVGFPLLFLAGAIGLGIRGLRRLQPRLRRGERLPPAVFLAGRRLAAPHGGALPFVGATALAAGVLVYAGSLVASADSAVSLKLQMSVGAPAVASFARLADLPADVPAGAAVVGRVSQARLLPDNLPVDVLAVDSRRLSEVVQWPDGLSERPLAALLSELRSPGGDRLPALLAGQSMPAQSTLQTARARIPLRRVAALPAFPGIGDARRLVVVDMALLREAADAAADGDGEGVLLQPEVWANLAPDELASLLEERGSPSAEITSLDAVRSRADVQSVSWTFGYLRLFGVLAGVLALVGAVLYLHARQRAREVFYALAARMGLTPDQHRLAIAIELGGMLLLGGISGAVLGLAAARAVLGPLDPLPQMAPGPALAVPWALLAAAWLAVAATAVAGGALVQRAADRSDVNEVLRVAP